MSLSLPPLASIPPPTTTQFVALVQEIAFRKVVSGGTGSDAHVLPPSLLAKIMPVGDPSPGVASPTSKQRIGVEHAKPLKFAAPTGPPTGATLWAQVDPPSAVVRRLRSSPELRSPTVASLIPSTMQSPGVEHVTSDRARWPCGKER